MPYDKTLAERVRALFQGEPTYTKKYVRRNLLHGWPEQAIGVTGSHSASPFASPVIPKPNPTR